MKWESFHTEKKLSYILKGSIPIRLDFDKDKSYYEGRCQIGEKDYTILRRGFWKNDVNLINEQGTTVARLLEEKWQSRKWRLQIDEHSYFIKYQNNPVFELIVEDYASEVIIKYKLLADDSVTDVELNLFSKNLQKEHLNIIILIGWYVVIPIFIFNTLDSGI